jgi:hypothetical protein
MVSPEDSSVTGDWKSLHASAGEMSPGCMEGVGSESGVVQYCNFWPTACSKHMEPRCLVGVVVSYVMTRHVS